MGFFKDVDKGKVDDNSSYNSEEMFEGLNDISIDDALASMGDVMTGEEALASLDADYVKDIEEDLSLGDIEEIINDEAADSEVEDLLNDLPVDNIEDDIDLPDMVVPEEFENEEIVLDDNVEEDILVDEEIEESIEDTLEDIVAEDIMAEELAEDAELPVEDSETEKDVPKNIDEFETTVITKGTTIRGGITSDCSLDVMGVITGDVECLGKLRIYGTVSGNTSASEIYIETPQKLQGDLISTGDVIVSEDSVIVGTIQASSAHISGAVKGDIDVEDNIIIASTAVVYGNITAKTMMIEVGAVVHGICNIGSNDKDISAIFGE